MRGDLQLSSMMPVAPADSRGPAKPKLGFSIESIVGPPSSRVHPADRDSDPEVTPPPAHNHHSKASVPPPSTTPPYYRTEDLYSYGPYGPQRVLSSPKLQDYRTELVMGRHSPPGALAYPAVMSPYGSALSLGHCHGQYPLASYLVNRDYAAYPWLMARQPRILPYRPQGPAGGAAGFILHQFRKPKRVRTAFSPSQLLTLEHAFEKNHYVVGAERKQLAQNLNLTETQVKVWFQNRRTKDKRQRQEEGGTSNPNDDQSAGKSDTGSENGRPPSSSSPPIGESDVSDCEDEEDCRGSPRDFTRQEAS